MVAKMELQKVKTLKTVIDAILPVNSEVHINLNDKGFRAQVKDAGNIWMGDAFIPSSEFSNNEFKENTAFHIDLKDFSEFIKTARNNDTLSITLNQEKGSLDMELSSKTMTKRLSLQLITVEGEEKFLNFKELELYSSVTLEGSVLADAIKTVELGDENVQFTNSKDGLLMVSGMEGKRKAEAKISYSDEESVSSVKFAEGTYVDENGDEYDIPQTHSAVYALKFLRQIAKVSKSGESITLRMSDEFPLVIELGLADTESGYITFVIAPRKDDDEFGDNDY